MNKKKKEEKTEKGREIEFLPSIPQIPKYKMKKILVSKSQSIALCVQVFPNTLEVPTKDFN